MQSVAAAPWRAALAPHQHAACRSRRAAMARTTATTISAIGRRAALLGTTSVLPALALLGPQRADAANVATALLPLADLPMVRLRLPKGGVGRDYCAIKLVIKNQGPYEFMLDSGLTAELITPELRAHLGIRPSGRKVSGLGAGGAAAAGDLVMLEGASLCCGSFPASAGGRASELALPPLPAVVIDFPQAHLDPAHDVVGMLGQDMLQQFDADLDFPAGRVRLWPPGSLAADAEASRGLTRVPAAVLNETGVLGIRATGARGAAAQPFAGIVDCGASFSAVNMAAARLLGLLGPSGELAAPAGPPIVGLGVDGRPTPLPTTQVAFTFAGDAKKNGTRLSFAPPPKDWKPWAPVLAAVGDLPIFSQLLGDGQTPFTGPAALIGLDVLAQRRVVLESAPPGAARSSRQRGLLVASK